ncbi:MAG: hypothetical protein KAT46_07235 [Deltaproteobacteria bacterium]|nr:hypothetical protein [Deltaproteobacteria bacterium]
MDNIFFRSEVLTINWKGLREVYEDEKVTLNELAERYKCHVTTITRRARREGWLKFGKKKEKEKQSNSAGVLKEHRRLLKKVRKQFTEALRKGEEAELKLVKTAGSAILDLIKGERQAWGINEKDLGTTVDDIFEIAKAMDEVTVSHGAEETLEGGKTLQGRGLGQKVRKD